MPLLRLGPGPRFFFICRPPSTRPLPCEPYRCCGRGAELALLEDAAAGGPVSVVALVGPGGQGKTAIVEHWLSRLETRNSFDGIFLWSFYRGQDANICLRSLFAYAEGLE